MVSAVAISTVLKADSMVLTEPIPDELVDVCRLRGCDISLEFLLRLPSLIAGVLLTSLKI